MSFINFGIEAIAFQDSKFADKLVEYVDKVMEQRSMKAAGACPAAIELNDFIFASTGMRINVIFDTHYPPCTIPCHINPDSILGHTSLKHYYAEESTKTLRRLKKVKEDSYIDLKNAKVSGIFSEKEVPVYMSYDFIERSRLDTREVVAILAHEIGHNFAAFEMAFRTSKTNQVLAAISKSHASGDKDSYRYVLKTTEEVFDFKSGVLQELVEVKNKETTLVVVLGKIEEDTKKRSMMGNAVYDITTFEAMADNYAARLGLGRELVTGLEKLHKSFNSPEYSSTIRVILVFMDIFSIAALILYGVMLYLGAFIGAPLILLWFLGTWLDLDGRDHKNVYDNLTTRFKRIKEQMIQYIKDNKLPDKDVKVALSSIVLVEKAMGEIVEGKGFLSGFFSMLDPASIGVNNAKDIQGKLEAIASNDLYVKAAQMRMM